MIQVLTSDTLPKPRFRYSPVLQAGPWILFSGMIALDPSTGSLETGGPARETAKILANLTDALPGIGVGIEHLASARIYTTRFEDFASINAQWDAWLGTAARPPARTSVGVSALPLGASVEIEFAFYRDE